MIFKKFNKKIIFIIGTGRSGTHLLGRTIASSEEVCGFIEDKKFFRPITNLAVGLNKNKKDLKRILKLYRKEFKKCKKEFILEKTHPNIWFVEELAKEFPGAKFIGINRSVYATVASMLKHKGVLKWYDTLPQNEINDFLGVTQENKEYFNNLPIEAKCALRWKAHNGRLNELKKKFPSKVLVVDYNDFYDNQILLTSKISNFVGLESKIIIEPLNPKGNTKWKTILSEEQVRSINKALND